MPSMMRRAYQTDLSDEEWEVIAPHLPAPKASGRPRVHPLREILNGVFYASEAAVPGVYFPMTSRPGKPSTITSEPGA